MILIVSNVEAFHTTNKHGRYDDQNLKNHKIIIVINNNYNIHDNNIIQRDSYKGIRYSNYNKYSKYNSKYKNSKYSSYNSKNNNYRTSKYSRSKHYTKSYKSRYNNYRTSKYSRSKHSRVRDSVYVY